MPMTNDAYLIGDSVGEAFAADRSNCRRITFGANATACRSGDLRIRQQLIGHVEDRRRHAIPDGEVRDLARRDPQVTKRLGPVALASRRRRLCKIAKNGQRTRRAATTDTPQRDRAVVLCLVDDHVSVGERCAVEQRIGLVDKELIGDRPLPTFSTWTGQQLVDQPDRQLRGPRLRDCCPQRGRLLPHIVAVEAAHHVALHDALHRVAPFVDRRVGVQRLRDPRRQLVGGDRDRPRAKRNSQILGRNRDVFRRRRFELIEHVGRALPAARVAIVFTGYLDLRDAELERRSLLHTALAQRRQHVGDVIEEDLVRPDHQHTVAYQSSAMLEQQICGAVQADGGLAGTRPTLHHKALVERRANDHILFGLNRRHDLAHGTRARGADLGEHGVGNAATRSFVVGVVELLVEVGRELAIGHREAAAMGKAERVGVRGAIERRRDRCPPVDHHRIVLIVLDMATTDVPTLTRAGLFDATEEVTSTGCAQVFECLGNRDLDVLLGDFVG